MATSINVSDRVKILTQGHEGTTGVVKDIWEESLYIKVDDIHGEYHVVVSKSKVTKLKKKKVKK